MRTNKAQRFENRISFPSIITGISWKQLFSYYPSYCVFGPNFIFTSLMKISVILKHFMSQLRQLNSVKIGLFSKELWSKIYASSYYLLNRRKNFLGDEILYIVHKWWSELMFLKNYLFIFQFKYKKRVYKMMHVNVRKLKQLHVKVSLLKNYFFCLNTDNIYFD